VAVVAMAVTAVLMAGMFFGMVTVIVRAVIVAALAAVLMTGVIVIGVIAGGTIPVLRVAVRDRSVVGIGPAGPHRRVVVFALAGRLVALRRIRHS
jgi:hypothetical protein